MSRLLILGLLALGLFWLWRRLPRPSRDRPANTAATPTVRCQTCGLHVPTVEATRTDSHWYCPEHAPRTHDS